MIPSRTEESLELDQLRAELAAAQAERDALRARAEEAEREHFVWRVRATAHWDALVFAERERDEARADRDAQRDAMDIIVRAMGWELQDIIDELGVGEEAEWTGIRGSISGPAIAAIRAIETERDARPDITAKDAATWTGLRESCGLEFGRAHLRVDRALRTHAAKAKREGGEG
jgi:hypothetical protein